MCDDLPTIDKLDIDEIVPEKPDSKRNVGEIVKRAITLQEYEAIKAAINIINGWVDKYLRPNDALWARCLTWCWDVITFIPDLIFDLEDKLINLDGLKEALEEVPDSIKQHPKIQGAQQQTQQAVDAVNAKLGAMAEE